MTPPVTGVPPELKGLPQAVLDAIHTACAGDWRRVEATGKGEWTIHNAPQFRRTQLPDARPRRYRRVNATKAAAPRTVFREPEPMYLPEHIEPMQAAKAMAEEFSIAGIAPAIRIELSEQVMKMEHSLVELGVAACRWPDRVEVDPATVEKGVRLRFVRGSVLTVAAFQNITLPYIIAIKHVR